MNGYALLSILAGMGTVASFLSGLRSMIYYGRDSALSSTAWMFRRVLFQGLAFVAVLAGLLSKAA